MYVLHRAVFPLRRPIAKRAATAHAKDGLRAKPISDPRSPDSPRRMGRRRPRVSPMVPHRNEPSSWPRKKALVRVPTYTPTLALAIPGKKLRTMKGSRGKISMRLKDSANWMNSTCASCTQCVSPASSTASEASACGSASAFSPETVMRACASGSGMGLRDSIRQPRTTSHMQAEQMSVKKFWDPAVGSLRVGVSTDPCT
mmetsp:Transcript_133658/g.231842  ORF Transcript_133658/g.231842 Transcript_133658/m.231842 type:complete len:200 (-) Transcript_133658:353-952(-)